MSNYPEYLQKINGEWWLIEDERENMKVSYRLKEVIVSESSPFQQLMILDSYDFGRMLVLDGAVQTTSVDGHIYNEMITHVPLCIHPNPKRVLIIGGGDCGAAREVAKYDQVEQIDLVEIDEAVVRLSKEHLPEVSGNLSDPRVRFIYQDGIQFVKDVEDFYDVIIVDSSDPVGPAVQLFEKSFYENIHRALKADGLMVCQSQSPLFHQHVTKQTLTYIDQLFAHSQLYITTVPTYPGGFWSFTLGSKQYTEVNPDSLVKQTQFVNKEVLHSCFAIPEFLRKGLQKTSE